MKITHNQVGKNLNLSDSNRTDKSNGKSPLEALSTEAKSQAQNVKDIAASTKSDATKVDLSERAQDIRQAKELAQAVPDVNMEKVEKFRKLIDEGKYKIDAKAISDKMINENLMNLGQPVND